MKYNTISFILFVFLFSFTNAQSNKEFIIKSIDINDEYSNFGTSYFGDNQIIFASPTNHHKIIKRVWKQNEQPYLDLYLGEMSENGEIINVEKLNPDVNSKYHEADVVYTNDYKKVYFTRDNYYNKKLNKDDSGETHLALFSADVVNPGVWENIQELPFNDKNYSVGHPALSPDNKTIYFVTDVPGTYGKTDIYKATINSDGTYGTPENLGKRINTVAREMFPYIDGNNTMYFSSDRGGGHGNLDIYSIDLNKPNSQVKNLGTPINSISDDFAYLKKKGEDHGYFSSNRKDGKGDDDIYYFIDLDYKEPCQIFVKGKVIDKNSSKELKGAIVVLYDKDDNEVNTAITNKNGSFSFDLDCDNKYKAVAFKEKYSQDSKEFDVSKDSLSLELKLAKPSESSINNFAFQQVSKEKCKSALENINNIYFDLDKANIRPEAAVELDKVIYIMKKCPSIHVRASSHTDSRASFEYNKELSQRRAESTVRYIVNKGKINPSRLTAVGYGETMLLNRCSDDVECTESEHRMNRRTQFDIID